MKRSHLVACLIIAGGAALQAQVEIEAISPVSTALARGARSSLIRSQQVSIRQDLFDAASAGRFVAPMKLGLKLFDDVDRVVATLDRATVSADGGSVIWTGTTQGEYSGEFLLVKTGGIISGHVVMGDIQYIIRTENGAFVARESQEDPAPCGTADGAAGKGELYPNFALGQRAAVEDGSTIDLMVVYTPDARRGAGSAAALENSIHFALAVANGALAASKVQTQLRLVYYGEVNYTETSSGDLSLRQLAQKDGVIDDVLTLRDQHGADLVMMIVNVAEGICGQAQKVLNSANEPDSTGFSIVVRACLEEGYTFIHEVGHNLGAQHHRSDPVSVPFLVDSFGYKQASITPFFRDVMAYACDKVNCPRISYFSNPNITYRNLPVGGAGGAGVGTDNAKTLNLARSIVANWRSPNPSALTLSSTSAAFSSAGGPGTLVVTASAPWRVYNSNSWITTPAGGGLGSTELSYRVFPNQLPMARTGSISVGGRVIIVEQAAADSNCTNEPILINVPVASNLTASDCPSPTRPGTRAKLFWFRGVPGQAISINADSAAFDTFVAFHDTGLSLYGSNDDNGASTNSRLPVISGTITLPATGTYVVEVASSKPGGAGPFSLKVSDLPSCAFSLSSDLDEIPVPVGGGFVGGGFLRVTTGAGCAWSSGSKSSWLDITSNGERAGSGPESYSVDLYRIGKARAGALVAAGHTYTVLQRPAYPCWQQTIELVPGAPARTGLLNSASCKSTFFFGPKPWSRYFQFAGHAGQTVTLNSLLSYNGTFGGGLLSVHRPSGDAGAYVYGSYQLPETGVYSAVLTALFADAVPAGSSIDFSVGMAATNQCGATPAVSRIENGPKPGSGVLQVDAAAGCTWKLASTEPWLIPEATEYTGPAEVRFTFEGYAGALPRQAWLIVGNRFVEVEQRASVSRIEAFVWQLYSDLLARQPDSEGMASWVSLLSRRVATREAVAAAFFRSPEFSGSGMYILKLYRGILRRDPDFEGWLSWYKHLLNGIPQTQILEAFLNSPEFFLTYGNLNNDQFVKTAYENVLGRTPSPQEVTNWVGFLGSHTRTEMMEGFITSVEFDIQVRNRGYANLLYMGFLRRNGEAAGVTGWANVIAAGQLEAAIAGFVNSAEYQLRF